MLSTVKDEDEITEMLRELSTFFEEDLGLRLRHINAYLKYRTFANFGLGFFSINLWSFLATTVDMYFCEISAFICLPATRTPY